MKRSKRALVPGWTKARNIQGYYSEKEARLLSSLCTGLWVEIGCYKGRSTMILAETGHDGYAIDTWRGSSDPKDPSYKMPSSVYVDFLKNIDEYENVIIVRRDFRDISDAMIPPTVRLLHLDADHSYELTKAAFDKFSDKVIVGGHVAFHDAHGGGWPDVERFVSELDPEEWKHADSADMLAAYQRV